MHSRSMHSRPLPADRPDPQVSPAAPRDLVLDLLRSGSLLVVVVWHWVFSTVRWSGDGPHVGNPIGITPGLWVLTWLGQVMPLFFIVGGALHARSLSNAGADGFRIRRIRRLMRPALPLLAVACVVLVSCALLGRDDWFRAVVLVISPLWFLATYLVCVLAAPWAQRLHRRGGGAVVVVGIAGVALLDRLRIDGTLTGPVVVGASFALVWSTVHQLGWFVDAARSASRGTKWVILAAGVAGLWSCSTFGPYPAAMVGVPGQRLSNLGPPTLMVIWLALAQLGLVALADARLRTLSVRVEDVLRRAGGWSMTVYVWHLLAFGIFWAGLVAVGLAPSSEIDPSWWLQRPIWLLGPLLIAVPLCRLTRRFDSRGPVPRGHGADVQPSS